MPQFVVLLRGVNVGKGNRVPMGEFKLAMQGLGYSGVVTLLNSGNAVFSSPTRTASKHVEAIASLLEKKFNVTTPVVVKSAAEFHAIVQGNPIAPSEPDHPKFLVAFAQSTASLAGVAECLPRPQPPERLAVSETAIYLHCAQGLLQSKVAEALLGKASKSVTSRNWATVLKLRALLSAA